MGKREFRTIFIEGQRPDGRAIDITMQPIGERLKVWVRDVVDDKIIASREMEVVVAEGILDHALTKLREHKAGIIKKPRICSCGAISCDDEILGGLPVVEGTRIPVRAVKAFVDGGALGIREQYPGLEAVQIRDALSWPCNEGCAEIYEEDDEK